LILLVARRFDRMTATEAKGLAEASPFSCYHWTTPTPEEVSFAELICAG
jgi:hypothetical protein